VLAGSDNFSVASLDYNRELGILTHDRAVVTAIAAALSKGYAAAAP
jgi:phosphatidylserine/phosphatidylglycerophosphate/cardiolipin synthase-like enzyme